MTNPAGIVADSSSILAVGDLLSSEHERLRSVLRQRALGSHESCATDPVSDAASLAILEKTNSLFDSLQQHLSTLSLQAAQLAATARAYGASESDIARSFRIDSGEQTS